MFTEPFAAWRRFERWADVHPVWWGTGAALVWTLAFYAVVAETFPAVMCGVAFGIASALLIPGPQSGGPHRDS